ncbi:hypothetical protein GCM10025884_18860 [Leuconostoc gelidum subsp. gelidum]|nr:hypothetical protein GCM10025884_18860 [Leuconostoc gelidum subsp. gelidum]
MRLTNGPIIVSVPKMKADPVICRKYNPKKKFKEVIAKLKTKLINDVFIIVLNITVRPFLISNLPSTISRHYINMCSIVYVIRYRRRKYEL